MGIAESLAEYQREEQTVYRHVGHIVVLASTLEQALILMLARAANLDRPSDAMPLLNGTRLSGLIDMAATMLPPSSDRKAFIGALRQFNDYRDLLAHSFEAHDEPDDDPVAPRRRFAKQTRRARVTHSLDIAELPEIELKWMALVELADALNWDIATHGDGSRTILDIAWGHIDVSKPPSDYIRSRVGYAYTLLGHPDPYADE